MSISLVTSTLKGVEQRKAAIACLYELFEVQNKRAVGGYFHEEIGRSGNKENIFVLFRTRYFEQLPGDRVKECPSCKTVEYTFSNRDILSKNKVEKWLAKAEKVVMKHHETEEEYEVFLRYDLKDK